MKYSLSFIILSLFFFYSCQKSLFVQQQQDSDSITSINPNHPMKDSLQVIIDKYVQKGLPGVQVAVKNTDGLFITGSGFTKIESGSKFRLTTPSWLFSITKMYTASLIMKMKEQHLIDIDKPITAYLDAGTVHLITGAEKITARMLLSHSSGIVNITELAEFMVGQFNNPFRQPSVKKLLSMLKGKALLFTPGTDFSYSNTNYLLLQLILEKITGKPYENLLRTEITGPLQLSQTWFNIPEEQTAELGFPNYYFDRYANEQLENVSRWNTALANGSRGYGGIAATPADAIRFFEALLKGEVVSASSLQEMKTWFKGKNSVQPDYGLGLEYYQYAEGTTPQFGHEGDGIGCTTQLFYVPDNNTILYINCTAGRKLAGPYLFKTTDMKNELCRYAATWRQ